MTHVPSLFISYSAVQVACLKHVLSVLQLPGKTQPQAPVFNFSQVTSSGAWHVPVFLPVLYDKISERQASVVSSPFLGHPVPAGASDTGPEHGLTPLLGVYG